MQMCKTKILKFIIVNVIINIIITTMASVIIIYFVELHSTHPEYGKNIQGISAGRPCYPWMSCR
jgi:hypothetical protein